MSAIAFGAWRRVDIMIADPFRDRLLTGEKVLWTGQPQQGIVFTASDILLIPFSVLWGGFAIFWEAAALHGNPPLLFPAFGVPFVLVGLYLIIGRFIHDAWARSKTAYAVTSQRIFIARSAPFARFTALAIDKLPAIVLSEGSNGRGTITFGETSAYWRRGGFGPWTPALDPTPRFIGIENVRRVFDLIQRLTQAKAA
jgi:hypothetical protein